MQTIKNNLAINKIKLKFGNPIKHNLAISNTELEKSNHETKMNNPLKLNLVIHKKHNLAFHKNKSCYDSGTRTCILQGNNIQQYKFHLLLLENYVTTLEIQNPSLNTKYFTFMIIKCIL